ncbi:hypothetical protein RJT34_18801 [Clitoria ternatea]|uniref:Uncharacterized protein n=1 Tax=Clitoria ternatea TaxID=43366 RepID=A0AAN9JBG3_CLITE
MYLYYTTKIYLFLSSSLGFTISTVEPRPASSPLFANSFTHSFVHAPILSLFVSLYFFLLFKISITRLLTWFFLQLLAPKGASFVS